MNFSEIVLNAARAQTSNEVVNIIEFIDAPWGLGGIDPDTIDPVTGEGGQPEFKLFPVQRMILKAYYGIALDDNPYGFDLSKPVPEDHPHYNPDLLDQEGYYKWRIPISDFRRQNWTYYTEAGYLRQLYAEGRSNIREVVPGVERRELVLAVGRRSGKSLMSSCIAAYETYRLISKGDPQAYYGMAPSATIRLVAVATGKDQAGLLYNEVSGHFQKCAFFSAYAASNTMAGARFQTPSDIARFGSYKQNKKAKAGIQVSFKSSVAKGLRGAAYYVIILDEVAHFPDDGQTSAEKVYEAIVPAAGTFTEKDPTNRQKKKYGESTPLESKIISISSPLGRQGQFYKLFNQGFKSAEMQESMLCIQAATWEVNPTVPAQMLTTEFMKDARSFETEWGAQFSDRTRGWMSDRNDIVNCIDTNLRKKTQGPPRMPHVAGIDIALVGDQTAISIGHVENGKIITDVVDYIQAGKGKYAGYDRLQFDDVVDWIYDYSRRFYIAEGVFDAWGGDVLEQALAKRGLTQFKKMNMTPMIKSQMFQTFKDVVFDQRIAFYNDAPPDSNDLSGYLLELLELQEEVKSKNIISVEAPKGQGKHDDQSDALVRMVYLAMQNLNRLSVGGPNSALSRQLSQSMAAINARRKALMGGTHESRMAPKRNRFGNLYLPPGMSGGGRKR